MCCWGSISGFRSLLSERPSLWPSPCVVAGLGCSLPWSRTVGVAFEAARSVAAENSGLAVVTVKLSAPAPETVTVRYAVSGGTARGARSAAGMRELLDGEFDYLLEDGMLTFTVGEVARSIPITIVDDQRGEASETIRLRLLDPSANALLWPAGEHVVTLSNNDPIEPITTGIANPAFWTLYR